MWMVAHLSLVQQQTATAVAYICFITVSITETLSVVANLQHYKTNSRRPPSASRVGVNTSEEDSSGTVALQADNERQQDSEVRALGDGTIQAAAERVSIAGHRSCANRDNRQRGKRKRQDNRLLE